MYSRQGAKAPRVKAQKSVAFLPAAFRAWGKNGCAGTILRLSPDFCRAFFLDSQGKFS
jgi:hypothetical protein